MQGNDTQKIKINVNVLGNKHTQIWEYPSYNKYTSFLSFIANQFGVDINMRFTAQYQDDEGDNINITSDKDIDDALLFAKHESHNFFNIFISISLQNTSRDSKTKQPSILTDHKCKVTSESKQEINLKTTEDINTHATNM
eukprot:308362_1